jgi:hypothetical protein
LTTRQELSRQRVGLASPNNSDTHGSNAGRGAAQRANVRRTVHWRCRRCRRGSSRRAGYNDDCTCGGARDRRSYKLHSGGFSRGLETSCCGVGERLEPRSYKPQRSASSGGQETSRGGAGGGPEPADIEGARSRSHGPAAERPELGLREQESLHRWTGTTCLAAPLACSDWSVEREVGWSRLDRVEDCGDNGKPGRTGRRPRCAVAGVLTQCAVGALDLTPRDLISHRFTLFLYKGLSRDQRHQSPTQLHKG